MKVLVLLEVAADVRIPPERDPRSGRVREEWLVREVDPASTRALRLALDLKTGGCGADVTVAHMGPPSAEIWLRRALAQGADRAVRVWDAQAAGAHAAAKSVILAAAARAAGFDLVLGGAAGVTDAGGQLGVLLAAQLGVPCLTQAVDIILAGAEETLEVTRALDQGYRERVAATLPAVVTVAGGALHDVVPPTLSASALLAADASDIPVWDLADLGVPFDLVRRAEEPLCHGAPLSRRPKSKHLAAPDASLPAFDRILKLIEGSVQRREGRVVRDSPEAVVKHIFRTLLDEGWLDHLRRGAGHP